MLKVKLNWIYIIIFKNKLTRIINFTKQNYTNNQINNNITSKEDWKTVNNIINKTENK